MESEKLSIYDIINGMFLSIDNAKSLIEDAELLLKHRRFARTFVISQLASEEIGKAFILYNLYMALKIDGIPIDHKKIRKAFYDHKSKTFEATMADFMIVSEMRLSEEEEKVAVEALCKEIVRGREEYNTLKNRGLYISFEDGKFLKPEDSISKNEAVNSLKKAKERHKMTYKIAKREVDFDLDNGTHPRLHTDL